LPTMLTRPASTPQDAIAVVPDRTANAVVAAKFFQEYMVQEPPCVLCGLLFEPFVLIL